MGHGPLGGVLGDWRWMSALVCQGMGVLTVGPRREGGTAAGPRSGASAVWRLDLGEGAARLPNLGVGRRQGQIQAWGLCVARSRQGAAPVRIEGRRRPPQRRAELGKVAVVPLGRSWQRPEKATAPIHGQGRRCSSGPVGGGDQAAALGGGGWPVRGGQGRRSWDEREVGNGVGGIFFRADRFG